MPLLMNDNSAVWSLRVPRCSPPTASECDLGLTRRRGEGKNKNPAQTLRFPANVVQEQTQTHTGSCGRVIITRHFLRADVEESVAGCESHICASRRLRGDQNTERTQFVRGMCFFLSRAPSRTGDSSCCWGEALEQAHLERRRRTRSSAVSRLRFKLERTDMKKPETRER